MLTTKLKSFDSIVGIATTSSSVTLSLTRIGLIVLPISTSITYGLSIGSKVIYEIVMQKYNKNETQYEEDQETLKSFDKLYRKSLQDNLIDKNEYESSCNNYTKNLD